MMNEKKMMQTFFFDPRLHSWFQEQLLLLVLPENEEEMQMNNAEGIICKHKYQINLRRISKKELLI